MECRKPLFTYPPKSSPPIAASTSYSPTFRQPSIPPRISPRTSKSSTASHHSVPSEPVSLPIPRNLVLISLLEATKQTVGLPGDDDNSEKVYESGDDDEHVLAGMNLISTESYGTYVVRERNGLVVHDRPPEPQRLMSPTADKENQECKSMSNSFSTDDEIEVELQKLPSADTTVTLSSTFQKLSTAQEEIAQMRLSYGQTVQVVSFENGIAKLARGRGYLAASGDQLVKSK
jgi:hypothetical protein